MSSDTSLSQSTLMTKIGENPDELSPSYIFELFAGLLFGALLAIEKNYQYPAAGEIMDGVRKEFIKHAKPVAELTDVQFNSFIAKRFQEYSECMNNQSGAGPIFHIGKQYYWNIIGHKKEDVANVTNAGLYIFKATELVGQILKDYKVIS